MARYHALLLQRRIKVNASSQAFLKELAWHIKAYTGLLATHMLAMIAVVLLLR